MRRNDRIPSVQLADLVRRDPGIKERLFLTCSGRTDGAGAQAHAIMAALAFSRLTGIQYRHSPFSSVSHSEGDPAAWANAWENFFGLGCGEAALSSDDKLVPLEEYLADPSLQQRPCIVTARRYDQFVERSSNGYDGVVGTLRERYRRQDKSMLARHGREGRLNIAVHVRRGDVTGARRHGNRKRFTEDAHVCGTIQDILGALGDARPTINLYSEGDAADFSRFADLGATLHLGTSPFEALHNCVIADILVMAKSSFSYVAAMLSEGVKIYEPFWHPPLNGWLIRSTNPLERLLKQQRRKLSTSLEIVRARAPA